jgi:hypothetical protein
MLTPHTLLLVLSQVSMLGETGESCRTDADCIASLACVRAVCSPRAPVMAPPPVASPTPMPPPPTPALAPTPRPPPPTRMESASQVVAEAPIEPTPPPGQFSGVHFALGAQVGAGPAFIRSGTVAVAQAAGVETRVFEGVATYVPIELRVALLLGRFEVAIEGAPLSSSMLAASPRSLAPVALSLGGLIKLHEQDSFGLYLPVRARGGLMLGMGGSGLFGGGSLGLGARFGALMLELRGGAEFLKWGLTDAILVPITAGATVAF